MKLGDIFVSPGSEEQSQESAPPAEPLEQPRFAPPTVSFLLARLGHGPHRIADLIAEWCGGSKVRQRDGSFRWESGRDGTNGQWIRDLNGAREALGVVACEGQDGRLWWKFPREEERRFTASTEAL